MIAALMRYPKSQRRAVAQKWAARSHAVQAQKRLARGPDAETVRKRALHDARGEVVADGYVCTVNGLEPWHVQRSLRGKTNQYDLVIDGELRETCGKRRMKTEYGIVLH